MVVNESLAELLKEELDKIVDATPNAIYKVLKKNILNLNIEPGTELKEAELGNVLNVSRTPIREAFIRLSEERLIKSFHKRGTSVSHISFSRVEEGLLIRAELEKSILKLACDKFSEKQLVRLKENLAGQKILAEIVQDYQNFHRFDNIFHSIIFEEVDKKGIWELIEKHCSDYHRTRVLMDTIEKINISRLLSEHENIINIIENKQREKIDEIINKHICSINENFDVIKNRYKLYFE